MKKGFYMGYDAGCLKEAEIREQAALLLNRGLYTAGYRTLRLGRIGAAGRFDDIADLVRDLRAMGFELDVTVCSHEEAKRAENLRVQMITLADMDDAEAEVVAEEIGGRVRVAIATGREKLSRAAKLADVVILDIIPKYEDFFELTRNQLDSCRDGDTDIDKSEANLRADAMEEGGTYQPGNVPMWFDHRRNEAVFIQMCMLGCPLVLEGNIALYAQPDVDLISNARLLQVARSGLGRTIRYYDPWHVMLGKSAGPRGVYRMILNRCHGDTRTDILPADLGWEGRFAIREWPEDQLVGANLEHFAVHVETSDHPETPCCRLYQITPISI